MNTPSCHSDAVIDDITAVLGSLQLPEIYDIEDISLSYRPDSTLVIQIVVDKDGGVDLDSLTVLHRSYITELEERIESVLGTQDNYEIEFMSRGVSSPLTLPRHWRRNCGRKVKIKFQDNRQIIARVGQLSPDEKEIMVIMPENDELIREVIPLTDIKNAKVEVEFQPASSAELALCQEFF